MKILVTGASGNVGKELVSQLLLDGHAVVAGTRDGSYSFQDVPTTKVDFEREAAPSQTFDAVFLMRPPHLADVRIFERFLSGLNPSTRVVFLSVQGADKKSYLPHAKIEKKIADMGFEHVFVRPSYFIENLLTTLWPELEENRRIFLPAGSLELDWVSVRDIACVAKAALTGEFAGHAVTVCSGTRLRFDEVCAIINRVAGTQVSYHSPSLLTFVRCARKRGQEWSFIGVMLLLHFLPRFERSVATDCSDCKALLGREPETLEAFVARHLNRFEKLK